MILVFPSGHSIIDEMPKIKEYCKDYRQSREKRKPEEMRLLFSASADVIFVTYPKLLDGCTIANGLWMVND